MKLNHIFGLILFVPCIGINDMQGMEKKKHERGVVEAASQERKIGPKIEPKAEGKYEPKNEQKDSKERHGTMNSIREQFTKMVPLTKKKSKDQLPDRSSSIVIPQEPEKEAVTKQSPPTRNITLSNSLEERSALRGEDKPFGTQHTEKDLRDLEQKVVLLWWQDIGRKNRPALTSLFSLLLKSEEVKQLLDTNFKPGQHHSDMYVLFEKVAVLFTKFEYGLTDEEKETKEIFEQILSVKRKNKEKRAKSEDDIDIFGARLDQ